MLGNNKRRLSAAEKKSIETENAAKAAALEQAWKEFECSICLNLVLPYNEPAVLNGCGHIFHRNCIKTCLGEAASAECPDCRDRFIAVDVKDLRSVPTVWRLLQNLRLACPLDCGTWKGDVSNLDNHYETCAMTQCPLNCGTAVKPPTTFEIHDTTCPKFVLTCTNDGCTAQVTREDMPDHAASCGHAVIRCAWPACRFECKRKQMVRHEKDAAYHLDLDEMYVAAPATAKEFTVIQTVSVKLPPDLRMPTVAEQADESWSKVVDVVPFFVGPFTFNLSATITNKGLLSIGAAIDDDRIHHIQIGQSQRLEKNSGILTEYRTPYYVELVSSERCHFFDEYTATIDKWLLKDNSNYVFEENGTKVLRVDIRIYVHKVVLVGDECDNAPTEGRELGPEDGVKNGVKWGKCPF